MISNILWQLGTGSARFDTGSGLANAPFDFLGSVLRTVARQLYFWGS